MKLRVAVTAIILGFAALAIDVPHRKAERNRCCSTS